MEQKNCPNYSIVRSPTDRNFVNSAIEPELKKLRNNLLHFCRMGDGEMVKMILNKITDRNYTDFFVRDVVRESLLEDLVKKGNIHVCLLLLEFAAKTTPMNVLVSTKINVKFKALEQSFSLHHQERRS